MNNTVVSVKHLSKRYRLGAKQEPYKTLRETIMNLGRGISKPKVNDSNTLWALKDVSFEVKQGEVLGIIGRNGAGKSTLLKILSRITEPTEGSFEIHGRVSSILEVGTGFHPELTGRENIYLNGAILGMKKREIKNKFDEIVSFAEVERFIDTPLKHYSSGMYLRLAFAVAAHLEPEILIVDEVLAVGDAEFQRKCLGKMKNITKDEGRTVLFVSHNIRAVRNLCSRGILLESGKVTKEGYINEVVDAYLSKDFVQSQTIPGDASTYCSGQAKFRKVQLISPSGKSVNSFFFREIVTIRLTLEVFEKINNSLILVVINSSEYEPVIYSTHGSEFYTPMDFEPGCYVVEIEYDMVLLPKKYFITLNLATMKDGASIDYVENVYSFMVDSFGAQNGIEYPWHTVHGYVQPKTKWRFSKQGNMELETVNEGQNGIEN